ncbi:MULTISPECIES: nuclear transport factor 2 family protein [unclassified Burkholderia]|uniref:nuclear transport factor 2 family protein n=1 Tax=unclassified Burkholderia TaxID=2613784 RepID=UPI001E284986|nr:MULTISPECIES: nuclear transport factor 2 family protein [unclassified Burkholderia]UEP33141.1 nuclear transport factor 2 family protein [Burkholderia sp. B21-007]UEP45798.1 nuclear transport factor 2 family protein [Burkholderia sp. B21-005]
MSLSLPDPVSAYFKITNGEDVGHIVRVFSQDAVVVDDGQTHQGHGAIESWRREVRKKFEYTVEPVSASQEGGRLTVTANVVGNFPGSPVQLDHVFSLEGDKIKSLEIG